MLVVVGKIGESPFQPLWTATAPSSQGSYAVVRNWCGGIAAMAEKTDGVLNSRALWSYSLRISALKGTAKVLQPPEVIGNLWVLPVAQRFPQVLLQSLGRHGRQPVQQRPPRQQVPRHPRAHKRQDRRAVP